MKKSTCFAITDKGCSILKVCRCAKCKFYKTTEQFEEKQRKIKLKLRM